jgi:hypothetical protein
MGIQKGRKTNLITPGKQGTRQYNAKLFPSVTFSAASQCEPHTPERCKVRLQASVVQSVFMEKLLEYEVDKSESRENPDTSTNLVTLVTIRSSEDQSLFFGHASNSLSSLGQLSICFSSPSPRKQHVLNCLPRARFPSHSHVPEHLEA